MPAFASVESTPIPLSRPSAEVGVFRYVPNPLGSSSLESLPNVRVLGIEFREGPDPGLARFLYVFDSNASPSWPRHFQDVLAVDSTVPGVVQNDDRLLVLTFNPDGSTFVLFDGFAQVPELHLTTSVEEVTFVAFGVAVRAWDTQIGGALTRDADKPSTVVDMATDLEVRFNPNGRPNATPTGADAVTKAGRPTFPTFLDPLLIRVPDLRRKWSLPMAARYLCFHENAQESYVANPDPKLIDALLDARSPIQGVSMVPDDPSTYVSTAIDAPDYPATGKAWPEALYDLLSPEGFGMTFRLETTSTGDPSTRLELFRSKDATTTALKDLLLQPEGTTLDPLQTNLGQAHLARDVSRVTNSFVIDSAPVRHEASFILSPGFAIASSDATDADSLSSYGLNHPQFPSLNNNKYRLYVFDETSEGHWDALASALSYQATSLGALLNSESSSLPPVIRRRVPFGELFSTDANSRPLLARLSISTDYAGTKPGLWDGSGTWQAVGGGFELLKDRLGIWINVPNPNGWNIQASRTTGAPYPSGIVKGVEDQAKAGSPRFVLRLTCVIEGDHQSPAVADRRPSSPVTYTVSRRVDARNRYLKQVVAAGSEFNSSSTDVIARDDSADALSEAEALRLAHEAGEVAGQITIPRFTSAYRIGDRIRSILGRNLSLRTNAGAPTIEGEVYPTVVGLTWDFDGQQRTILQLSDHRANPK